MKTLEGQTAIVTGGAHGIGFGIAKVLGAEGANVLIADIDREGADRAAAEVAKSGREAIGVAADVTDKSSLEQMAAVALARWNRIDALAANAGIYPNYPLGEITAEQFDHVTSVNVRGALFSMQVCLPAMIEQHYGRIVLTSSITGSLVGAPQYGHYGATKAALIGLMKSAALEVILEGITINAVCPGNIRTEGFETTSPQHRARMLASIPLGEFGEPEDVAWAVRYLVSPEARYVTGQTLVIDGGQVLPE